MAKSLYRNLPSQQAQVYLNREVDSSAIVDCYRDEDSNFSYYVTIPSENVAEFQVTMSSIVLLASKQRDWETEQRMMLEAAAQAEEDRKQDIWDAVMSGELNKN